MESLLPKAERRRLRRLEKEKDKVKEKPYSRPTSSNSSSHNPQTSTSNSIFNKSQLRAQNSKNPKSKGGDEKVEDLQKTREASKELRAKRNEKWNEKSKSLVGARRGQPDLGSRMEVLLGKIREGKS